MGLAGCSLHPLRAPIAESVSLRPDANECRDDASHARCHHDGDFRKHATVHNSLLMLAIQRNTKQTTTAAVPQ
jgi:hypothetical protein